MMINRKKFLKDSGIILLRAYLHLAAFTIRTESSPWNCASTNLLGGGQRIVWLSGFFPLLNAFNVNI